MKSAKEPKAIQPAAFPDCSKCVHGQAVEFGLFECRSRHHGPTPQPNCNARKVNCVYYSKKTGAMNKMSEWGDIDQNWNDDVSFVNKHEASSRIVDYSDRVSLNTEMRFDVIDSLSFEIPEKDCGYFAVTTKAISLLDVVNYIEAKKGSIDNAILFFYTVNDKGARYTAALSDRADLKVVISDLMNSQRQKERVITDILDKANVEIVFCHNHAKIAAIKIGDNYFVLSGSMNAGNNARIESLQIVNSKKHFDFVLRLYEKMKDEYQIKKRY